MEMSTVNYTPGFGQPGQLGSLAETKIQTTVGWIGYVDESKIGLHPHQMQNMRDILGRFSITNPATGSSIEAKVVKVDAKEDERVIGISKYAAEKLGLKVGDAVIISRQSDQFEHQDKPIDYWMEKPELFARYVDIWFPDPTMAETEEYLGFVESMEPHVQILKTHLDEYMEIIGNQLKSEHKNYLDLPVLLAFFFELGLGNEKNSQDVTFLHVLCRYGNCKTTEAVIKYQLDVNARTKENRTPMHEACKDGNSAGIGYLAKFDIDLSIQDHKGRTPLHDACKIGVTSYATNFKEAGKDGFKFMHIKDNKGFKAFDYIPETVRNVEERLDIIPRIERASPYPKDKLDEPVDLLQLINKKLNDNLLKIIEKDVLKSQDASDSGSDSDYSFSSSES